MNEDQLAAAQFAMELAAGLGYVDQQTTNRPSNQPPALRTDPRELVKKVVQETRTVQSNQAQLVAPQQTQVQQIPMPAPIQQQILQQPIMQTQPIIQQIQPNQPVQLELSFDMNEKKEIINSLRSIDQTLKEVLEFLNDNCTKKRRAGKTAGEE